MSKKITVFMVSLLIMGMGFIGLANAKKIDNQLNLSTKQQCIASIATYTAVGNLEQLKPALNDGLNAGLTINEIKEILVQMYAYAGFPRSLNGLNTFIVVIEERQQKGINDPVGDEAKPLPTDKNKYEIGKDNLNKLTGIPQPTTPTGYAAFAPEIDVFLKEHLFADIFGRGILDYQTRELATIAALISMNGVNSQLRSHFNVGLHNGLTEAQLRSLITIVGTNISKQQAENANQVLAQVLNARQ